MSTPRPGEVTYLSSRYRATRFSGGGTVLVVVFDYWRGDRNGFPESRQWATISELGYDQLSIACTRNDWFLSEDTPNLRRFLEETVSRYEEVVFFGSSMGGFGAMLFSTLADRICLISPQYSIDRRICAFETRWPSEAAGIQETGDVALDVALHGKRHARGILVYDPKYHLDARHAVMIRAAFPCLECFRFPFAGHPAAGTMLASGRYADFSRAMFRGDLTPSLARDLHRRGRRKSALYLTEMAVTIKGRNPHGARKLLYGALELLDGIPSKDRKASLLFRIASNLVDVGDYSKIHRMRWALDNKTTPPAWWRRRIRQSYQLRDRDTAAITA